MGLSPQLRPIISFIVELKTFFEVLKSGIAWTKNCQYNLAWADHFDNSLTRSNQTNNAISYGLYKMGLGGHRVGGVSEQVIEHQYSGNKQTNWTNKKRNKQTDASNKGSCVKHI